MNESKPVLPAHMMVENELTWMKPISSLYNNVICKY